MSSTPRTDLSTDILDYRYRGRFDRSYLILLALVLLAQGCNLTPQLPVNSQASPFLPATEVATQPVLPTATLAGPGQPTSTMPCQDNLSFTTDLTIPDGSAVEPGATLDKRWEVRNTGSCNWDERYSLRLVAGDPLGAKEQQALFPARSGANLVIRIEFHAPMQAGDYRSAWQAHNPAGEPFGDPIFITIIVTD